MRRWEIFIMCLVLYNAVSVPLDVSFGMPDQVALIIVEYGVDLIYAMDIIGNFRAAYVDAQGHLVRDADTIALNYLRMWFWIDL